jgi:hypothetical protein
MRGDGKAATTSRYSLKPPVRQLGRVRIHARYSVVIAPPDDRVRALLSHNKNYLQQDPYPAVEDCPYGIGELQLVFPQAHEADGSH